MMSDDEAPARGKAKGKGKAEGKGKGKGKGGRRGETEADSSSRPAANEDSPTKDQLKLAAFCQALMMSAEFRMIH